MDLTEGPNYLEAKKLGEVVEFGYISPLELKVAPTNNRITAISDNDRLEMAASIGEIGVVEPVILNEKNEIVQGQLRWSGALTKGIQKIPFIRMRFSNQFAERIASIIQDYLHHGLTDKDRYAFVKKCVDEDGKTYEDIAISLGINVETVRSWAKYQDVPKIIAKEEKAKQTLFNMPIKKKLLTDAVLKREPYCNDVEKAIDFIEFAANSPLREIEQAKKDVVAKTPVDIVARRQRLQENTTLLEIRIPKYLDTAFRNKLRKLNADYTEVLVSLIEKYVREQ
jgi:hypothetical protein